MNSLSWLIYAAELFNRLAGFLVILAVACCIAAVALFVASRCGIHDADFDTRHRISGMDEAQTKREFWTQVQNTWPLRFLKYAVICAVLSLPIPSPSTIYMIAASEMGEKIATTPEAREMLNDLRQIVNGKLRALKTEAVK